MEGFEKRGLVRLSSESLPRSERTLSAISLLWTFLVFSRFQADFCRGFQRNQCTSENSARFLLS